MLVASRAAGMRIGGEGARLVGGTYAYQHCEMCVGLPERAVSCEAAGGPTVSSASGAGLSLATRLRDAAVGVWSRVHAGAHLSGCAGNSWVRVCGR